MTDALRQLDAASVITYPHINIPRTHALLNSHVSEYSQIDEIRDQTRQVEDEVRKSRRQLNMVSDPAKVMDHIKETGQENRARLLTWDNFRSVIGTFGTTLMDNQMPKGVLTLSAGIYSSPIEYAKFEKGWVKTVKAKEDSPDAEFVSEKALIKMYEENAVARDPFADALEENPLGYIPKYTHENSHRQVDFSRYTNVGRKFTTPAQRKLWRIMTERSFNFQALKEIVAFENENTETELDLSPINALEGYYPHIMDNIKRDDRFYIREFAATARALGALGGDLNLILAQVREDQIARVLKDPKQRFKLMVASHDSSYCPEFFDLESAYKKAYGTLLDMMEKQDIRVNRLPLVVEEYEAKLHLLSKLRTYMSYDIITTHFLKDIIGSSKNE